MKRIYFLLTVFLLASLLLIGCSNQNNNKALSANSPEELAPVNTNKWVPYTDKVGSFSLNFSNQWTQQDTLAAQSIFLDYPDLNAAVKLDEKKIRLLSKSNGGVSSARNYALKKVQSKYVTFVDADDLVAKILAV